MGVGVAKNLGNHCLLSFILYFGRHVSFESHLEGPKGALLPSNVALVILLSFEHKKEWLFFVHSSLSGWVASMCVANPFVESLMAF